MTSKGFTLIELLVVIALTVIVTVGAASLFFTTLIGNSRKTVISSVKDEGDYAVSQMEFLLRNAIQLVPPPSAPSNPACALGMTSISFRSLDDGITTLTTVNGQIASQSATGTTEYLTSPAVTLSNLNFDCTKPVSGSGGYVNISFNLQKQAVDYVTATPVTQTFTTSANVRTY